MGAISLLDLFSKPALDQDNAVPIGADKPNRPLTLMRIHEEAGELVYGGETGEVLKIDTLASVEYSDSNKEDQKKWNHCWTRIEFKSPVGRDDIRAGDQLVVAFWPWTSGSVSVATFKHGWRPDRFKEGLPKPINCTSPFDAIKFMERLGYNFTSTRDRWLTAGFSQYISPRQEDSEAPQNPDKDVLSLRYKTPEILSKRTSLAELENGNLTPQPQAACGICESFSEYEKSLQEHNYVRKLKYLAETGRLRFSNENPSKREAGPPKLFDDVKEDIEKYMIFAIRQALAGPVSKDEIKSNLVVKMVEKRFKNLLNGANRRYQTGIKREMQFNENFYGN